MTATTTFATSIPRGAATSAPLLPLVAAWWREMAAKRAITTARRRARVHAAELIERAAHYEHSQPGYAADLRAAAALRLAAITDRR